MHGFYYYPVYNEINFIRLLQLRVIELPVRFNSLIYGLLCQV